MGRWGWPRDCEQCGRSFDATRADAKFCGVNCRKASQRKLKNIEKLARNIIALQDQLRAMTTSDDLRTKWAAQKQIKLVRENANKF